MKDAVFTVLISNLLHLAPQGRTKEPARTCFWRVLLLVVFADDPGRFLHFYQFLLFGESEKVLSSALYFKQHVGKLPDHQVYCYCRVPRIAVERQA